MTALIRTRWDDVKTNDYKCSSEYMVCTNVYIKNQRHRNRNETITVITLQIHKEIICILQNHLIITIYLNILNETLILKLVKSHSGARETIIAGPYQTSFRMRRNQDADRRRGEGCPLTIWLEVWGRRKLPQGGPGDSPGRKWILCNWDLRLA